MSFLDTRWLQKVDDASYAWRNAKHRRNRRKINKWARVMWNASGKAWGLPATQRNAQPIPNNLLR